MSVPRGGIYLAPDVLDLLFTLGAEALNVYTFLRARAPRDREADVLAAYRRNKLVAATLTKPELMAATRIGWRRIETALDRLCAHGLLRIDARSGLSPIYVLGTYGADRLLAGEDNVTTPVPAEELAEGSEDAPSEAPVTPSETDVPYTERYRVTGGDPTPNGIGSRERPYTKRYRVTDAEPPTSLLTHAGASARISETPDHPEDPSIQNSLSPSARAPLGGERSELREERSRGQGTGPLAESDEPAAEGGPPPLSSVLLRRLHRAPREGVKAGRSQPQREPEAEPEPEPQSPPPAPPPAAPDARHGAAQGVLADLRAKHLAAVSAAGSATLASEKRRGQNAANLKGRVGSPSERSRLSEAETVWREAMALHHVGVPLASWAAKEKGMVRTLAERYGAQGWELSAAAMRYVVEHWSSLGKRFKSLGPVPSLSFLAAMHATLIPEASMVSRAQAAVAAFDAYFVQNPHAFEAPEAIESEAKKARAQLAQLQLAVNP